MTIPEIRDLNEIYRQSLSPRQMSRKKFQVNKVGSAMSEVLGLKG